jgi:nucleotide-binding universal stress UspA family protein
MFERILLAVDGSEHSDRAVAAATDIARTSKAAVHVIHVHEAGLHAPIETNSEAEDIVERALKQLDADRIEATGSAVAVRSGEVAPSIVEAARELGCDLIVMGTRGLSDFSSLLIGSVAHKVLHFADCPVLVVR